MQHSPLSRCDAIACLARPGSGRVSITQELRAIVPARIDGRVRGRDFGGIRYQALSGVSKNSQVV